MGGHDRSRRNQGRNRGRGSERGRGANRDGSRGRQGGRDDGRRREGGRDGSRGGRSGGGSDRRGEDRRGGDRRSGQSRTDGRDRRDGGAPRRKPWSPESGTLPRWISEELARVTPRAKLAEASSRLLAAAQAFAGGRHGKAYREAEVAKQLSPRDATVREVMGLAAYRMNRWDQALRELKTFRRLTGETTHMPVEMDVLRALDRPEDVRKTWSLLRRLGGDKATIDEAKVVYGSFLLDQDDPRAAWEVANPRRIGAEARESEVRVWYVAARAAARLGDGATARKLYEAIQESDPGMPGMDELDRMIEGA